MKSNQSSQISILVVYIYYLLTHMVKVYSLISLFRYTFPIIFSHVCVSCLVAMTGLVTVLQSRRRLYHDD